MSNTNDWAVGSVSCSKSIIYVDVTKFSKTVSESCNGIFWTLDLVSLIVFEFSLFFRVESDIFTKEDLIVGSVDLINYTVSDTIFQEGDFPVEQWA